MWLLDVNLPNALLGILKKFGIDTDSSAARGWRNLSNGELAATAHKTGFKVILTRDRVFGESAGKVLRSYPQLAVIIIRIPQSRQAIYVQEFERQWLKAPISPKPGAVTEWP